MAPFNKFTDKEKEFIKNNFDSMTLRQMSAALNRSESGVKTWTLKLGLRRNNRFNWTKDRIAALIEFYPNHSAKYVARLLDTSDYVVYKKAERLGLKKSPEYLAALNKQMGENLQKNGFGTRFQKGQKPWSAGKKIGTRGRTAETQFKKGQQPHNTCKIGDIRKPSGYWKIKIAEPNVWKFLHIHLWTEANGEIHEGMCVSFKDGNPDNCHLENLELVSRKDLRIKNSIINMPPELQDAYRTIGRLTRAINKKKGKYAEK